VNWSEELVAEDPPVVVTTTSMVPAAWGGEITVIEVVEFTVMDAAGKVPNRTVLTLAKFVPVIVTLVPPAVLPEEGETPVTVGVELLVVP
jgi:hypothetical protein